MQNLLLSAALFQRESYEELNKLGALKDFPDKQKVILDLITEYYNSDPSARWVDRELLKSSIQRKIPKHAEMLCTMVDELKHPSTVNVLKEVTALRRQKVSEDLAAALLAPNGEDKVAVLLNEYEQLRNLGTDEREEARVFRAKPLTDILSKTQNEARIRIYPDEIQEATGGLLRGHHVLVFARPDCGKSTMAINLAYGFLKQGLVVLYVINEDPVDDINLRMAARLSHRSVDQVLKDPEGTQIILDRRNYHNFIIADLTPGTPSEIVKLVEEHKPDVLIVDQSRNIEYPKVSKVESLEKIEQFIRNLGKKYDMLTISFTQAGDSAEGKLVLGLGDVDWSNTGMQACADLMIGMGVNEEYERSGRRMLSFPKNKTPVGDKTPRPVPFYGKIFKIGGTGR